MSSRIYEYAKTVEDSELKILGIRRCKDNPRITPVIAKGNAYQGIIAQW